MADMKVEHAKLVYVTALNHFAAKCIRNGHSYEHGLATAQTYIEFSECQRISAAGLDGLGVVHAVRAMAEAAHTRAFPQLKVAA